MAVEIKRVLKESLIAVGIALIGLGFVLGSEYIHPDIFSAGLALFGLGLVTLGSVKAVRNLTSSKG